MLNRQWVVGADGRLYHYVFFDPRRREMNGLSIYEFGRDRWRVAARLYAGQAVFRGGAWTAANGWARDFDAASRVKTYVPFQQRQIAMESADYFITEQPDADRMGFAELRRYVADLRPAASTSRPTRWPCRERCRFPSSR